MRVAEYQLMRHGFSYNAMAGAAIEHDLAKERQSKASEHARLMVDAKEMRSVLCQTILYKIGEVKANQRSVFFEAISDVLPFGAVAAESHDLSSFFMQLISWSGISLATGFVAIAGFRRDRTIELRDLKEAVKFLSILEDAVDQPEKLSEQIPRLRGLMRSSRIVFGSIPRQDLKHFDVIVESYAGGHDREAHFDRLRQLIGRFKEDDYGDIQYPDVDVSENSVNRKSLSQSFLSSALFFPALLTLRRPLYQKIDDQISVEPDGVRAKTMRRRKAYLQDQDKRTTRSIRDFGLVGLSGVTQLFDVFVKVARDGAMNPVSIAFNAAGFVFGLVPLNNSRRRVSRTTATSDIRADRLKGALNQSYYACTVEVFKPG